MKQFDVVLFIETNDDVDDFRLSVENDGSIVIYPKNNEKANILNAELTIVDDVERHHKIASELVSLLQDHVTNDVIIEYLEQNGYTKDEIESVGLTYEE
jgi:hypothetical protein